MNLGGPDAATELRTDVIEAIDRLVDSADRRMFAICLHLGCARTKLVQGARATCGTNVFYNAFGNGLLFAEQANVTKIN